jgi:hypothetical protein
MSLPDVVAMASPIDGQTGARKTVGRLEALPKWLNLIPMLTQWAWLSLRYGSLTLPTACNPAIASGGLAGEGKTEYFDIMGPHARAAVAMFVTLQNCGPEGLAAALQAMAAAGLVFPIIAKPDIGWCGFGVRLVRDEAALSAYLARYPSGERIVLQRFLPQEGEAGIFYVRAPGAAAGRITGILLRHFPRVVGDGTRTIAELVHADPRLRRLGRDGLSEPCVDPGVRPASGEVVRIATIGSTRVGGLYEDGTSLATPALTAAIDAIAQDMTQFHAGRFDIRFDSVGDLIKGEGFQIIEVNGAGSEAVHAWDPKFTLREAYAIVFAKQRLLFETGAAMRRLGHRPTRLRDLARLYLRQQRLIRRYPPSN